MDKSEKVRRAIAENINITVDIFEKLAQDKSKYVRGILAKNPNTPRKVLEKYVEDNEYHEDIRKAAIASLNSKE